MKVGEEQVERDRVVLITGAAGGIGVELVKRFLANGDTVVASDAKEESLAKLSSQIGPPANLKTIAANITEEAECNHLAEVIRKELGRVDVIVNCAGYFPIRPFEQISAKEWREVIDINLTGPFLIAKAILPLMNERHWGRVINFGSASMFEGVAGQSHYVAAKGGIVGFSRSIARELGKYGITVNIVTPGLTLTPNVKKDLSGGSSGKPTCLTCNPTGRSRRRSRWRCLLSCFAGRGFLFPAKPSTSMAAGTCAEFIIAEAFRN